MTVEKLLPQNVEAEAGVLGSILIDPEAIVQVADMLKPDDFYREAHRLIYEAALDLYKANVPADLLLLTDELRRRGHLDEIGGVSFVSALANQVPTSKSAKQYAQIVERTAILRHIISAAGQMASAAYSEPDADDALEEAEKLIFEIRAQRIGQTTARRIDKVLAAYWDALDKRQHAETRGGAGVATDFRDLDKLLAGLQKANLILVGARPSVGKTSVMLSMALNQAYLGHTAAIYSLEMSEEELIARLLAMDAGVELHRMRTGELTQDDWDNLSASVSRLANLNLYIDDTPALSLSHLRVKARQLMLACPFDVLYLDYLQLLSGTGETGGGSGGRRSENRVQEVSAISRGLKNLARELDVPVVALSQLSRALEARSDHKPMLSDLRESGSLEQDCDVAMFIHREEVFNPDTTRKNIMDILVAKHRNGPTGEVSLYWSPETASVHTLDRYSEGDTHAAPAPVSAQRLPYPEEALP